MDNDTNFWNQQHASSEEKPTIAEESDILRIEQKIDRLQCFLNDNYRELEETLKKQKKLFQRYGDNVLRSAGNQLGAVHFPPDPLKGFNDDLFR